MTLNEKEKKHIVALLMSNYQVTRMKLTRDKKLLKSIQDNTCTEKQWQELYFRFLKDK